MNIKLLILAALLLLLGHHLMTDESLHTDYIGFGLMLFFVAGLTLVLALEPILGRRS